MTWAAVGAQFGISAGMAFRVAVQGYKPERADIRAKLRAIAPPKPRKPSAKKLAALAFGFPWPGGQDSPEIEG